MTYTPIEQRTNCYLCEIAGVSEPARYLVTTLAKRRLPICPGHAAASRDTRLVIVPLPAQEGAGPDEPPFQPVWRNP